MCISEWSQGLTRTRHKMWAAVSSSVPHFLQVLLLLIPITHRCMEWKPTDVTILFVYCWISTCFGPTGPSSGEFVQLFTQPLVRYLSALVACSVHTEHASRAGRYWTNGCVNSCTNSPEDGPVDPKHVEIRQYTNKIVTSVDFHSIHHQEFKTVHTARGICQTATCLLAGTRWNRSSISFPLASSQQNLFDICLLLYVQSWTPDDGRKDRPKHVECYSKIK